MSRVALVYTYFGRDNYDRFIDSYKLHPAGYPHDFFPMIPGPGMNVGLYIDAAQKLDHDRCIRITDFGYSMGSRGAS